MPAGVGDVGACVSARDTCARGPKHSCRAAWIWRSTCSDSSNACAWPFTAPDVGVRVSTIVSSVYAVSKISLQVLYLWPIRLIDLRPEHLDFTEKRAILTRNRREGLPMNTISLTPAAAQIQVQPVNLPHLPRSP